MNRITFEWCAEDRARMDALLAAVEKLNERRAPVTVNCSMLPSAESIPEVEAGLPQDVKAAAADPVPAAKPVSLAEFQKEVTLRCAESVEMKKAVKALINEYAESISGIPEDKRSEVLARLSKL